ncbi:response regulator [Robertkochia flava]|uniref:response regulator n=1 Tax=Robertkochia flava TaxID=3447986 RepID=UPI001CC9B8AA|nr:response regulator [Robertkochia marina]
MPDKKLILIAEEDKMQATLLAFRLRRNGYRVEQVSHGEAALKFLKNYNPDMIICGIEMPGLHTFDFLKLIRKKYTRDLPVVILTHESENRLHSKLFEAGATECITKPVDPSLFLDMVEVEMGSYQ